MRPEYEALRVLGMLPGEDVADVGVLGEFEEVIKSIPVPITSGEADVLFGVLGDDFCFGAAWTVVHKLESMALQDYAIWIETVDATTYWGDLLVSQWQRSKT